VDSVQCPLLNIRAVEVTPEPMPCDLSVRADARSKANAGLAVALRLRGQGEGEVALLLDAEPGEDGGDGELLAQAPAVGATGEVRELRPQPVRPRLGDERQPQGVDDVGLPRVVLAEQQRQRGVERHRLAAVAKALDVQPLHVHRGIQACTRRGGQFRLRAPGSACSRAGRATCGRPRPSQPAADASRAPLPSPKDRCRARDTSAGTRRARRCAQLPPGSGRRSRCSRPPVPRASGTHHCHRSASSSARTVRVPPGLAGHRAPIGYRSLSRYPIGRHKFANSALFAPVGPRSQPA
jgi:hypothetical protein